MAFIARVLMYSRGNTTECFAYLKQIKIFNTKKE